MITPKTDYSKLKPFKTTLIAKIKEVINKSENDKKARLEAQLTNVETNFVLVEPFMQSWINRSKELDEQKEVFNDWENVEEVFSNNTQIIKYKEKVIFKSN